VVTAGGNPHIPRDPELLEDIGPDVTVRNAFSAHPKYFKSRIKALLKPCVQNPNATSNTPESPKQAERRLKGPLQFLEDTFDKFLLVPDAGALWLPFALFTSMKIMTRNKVDVVLTTSPPESAHILGLLLKRLFPVCWVADFRDLWTHNLAYWGKHTCGAIVRIHEVLEKKVLRTCDAIINIGPGEGNLLSHQYSDIHPGKFHVIPNGYDPHDFAVKGSEKTERHDGKLVLAHVGTVYPTTADEYFDGIESLLEARPELSEVLECRFVGFLFPEYENRILKSKYRKTFVTMGTVSYRESVRQMMSSDALVVLLGGEALDVTEIPGKIFMYMATQKPILGMTREGDTADILRDTGLAHVVNPHDQDALVNLLEKWCFMKMNGKKIQTSLNKDYVSRYNYELLTGKLSNLLTDLVAKNR